MLTCGQDWQAIGYRLISDAAPAKGADSDLTDAELRAAGRHKSSRQLPTYAKRTGKRLITATKSVATSGQDHSFLD